MPLSSLKLRPAKSEDVNQMCDIYFEAFKGNIPAQVCFPPSSKQAQHFWTSSLNEEFEDPNARFLVVTDTATTPETFVAFAKWNVVPTDAPSPPLPDNWPEEGNPELANEFFGKLAEMHEEIMGSRLHWYLELIATRPAYQGKGAGGMLMQWGVNRSDEDSLECYLDATPEGKPLYEKYGFRELETLKFFNGTYSHCFMIRDVKHAR